MKTLAVSLWDGQARNGGNARTVIGAAQRPPGDDFRAIARALFVAAYARLAPACRAVDEPGIAILAVDEVSGRPAGLAVLRARVGRPVAAIVGRHDHCDLYLDGSSTLALRQLAIVLGPVESWARGATKVRYRILDLHTASGMRDEDGRGLRGMRAEGPSIVRCAGYALFVLPVGDPDDWPEHADDAWAMLPDRVYFDELDAQPRGTSARLLHPAPPPAPSPSRSRQTLITRTRGPLDTSMCLVDRSDLAGTLAITGPHRRVHLDVGHDALRNGVLLGRYDRCDVTTNGGDETVSRVHALLLHDDDRLLVIDTSSTHGTRIAGDERERVIVIDRDLELQLGYDTRVRWAWVA